MKPAPAFLHSFAQALSAMNLYEKGHPARNEAAGDAFSALERLLEEDSGPEFSFLGEEVVYGDRQLRELEEWEWSSTLTKAGVERIEFREGVAPGEFREFLDRVQGRIETLQARGDGAGEGRAGGDGEPADAPARDGAGLVGRGDVVGGSEAEPDFQSTETLVHIRFGPIARDEDAVGEASLKASYPIDEEEHEALDWMFEEVEDQERLTGAVAEAVVRSLTVALHEEKNVLDLLAPLKEFDQYTTVHSMNVALLSMGMSERMGYGGHQVRIIGEAGLLHDSGKVRVPDEILNKTGKLTDDEYEIIKEHPEEGARIILRDNENMELAAVVAYEHHMQYGGGGYPRPRYGREMHPVSRIVHVCDVYDSLRTRRPYRDAWESERILQLLEEEAGTEFHPSYVKVFTEMIRGWQVERTGRAGESAPEGATAAG